METESETFPQVMGQTQVDTPLGCILQDWKKPEQQDLKEIKSMLGYITRFGCNIS